VPPTSSAVLASLQFTVFQFCREVWFLMLLSGSGDQLCNPLPALLCGVAYHWPALSLPCLSCVCLWRVWH
jgi:hypothetical protein